MAPNKKFSFTDYLKRKKVQRFGLFFLIAFVFLIFSKLSNDYKQTIKLKVNIVNIEDEIMLQNDSLNTLDAYVQAKGFALIPFLFKNYKTIVLDAKTDVNLKSGYYNFDVQKHLFLIEAQLGDSYKVLSVTPDTLDLLYAKRASKMIPVTFKSDIDYADGFDVKGVFTIDVDSIKIVGSSEDVNEIKELSTKVLALKDVNTNIDEIVKVDISDYNNIEVFPESIKISAEVTRFTEGTIEVPVTIINKPNGIEINYFPKTIAIAYYIDLENYKGIKASDFIVECDYSDLSDNQNYLMPKIIKHPAFVKRMTIKQKRIDFIKL